MFNSLFNLNLNPFMGEDGAVGGFDSSSSESSSSEFYSDAGSDSSAESDNPSSDVGSLEADIPAERTFTQSELNQIIQDRLAREKQHYTPYESLIVTEAKKYGMSPEQYVEAVQQQQQETQKQKYYDAGLDPDLVSEVVAQHPAVQWAQGYMSQQQQEQMFTNQAQELLSAYPDMDTKNIPPEVFQLNAQGMPLLDAYNRVMVPKMRQNQEKLKAQTIKEYVEGKTRNRVGITEGAGSAPVMNVSTPTNFNDAKSQALAYLKSLKE